MAEEQKGISLNFIFTMLSTATKRVTDQLSEMEKNTSTVGVLEMFKMQIVMNQLSQLSEMSTNVLSASHQAILGVTRNLK